MLGGLDGQFMAYQCWVCRFHREWQGELGGKVICMNVNVKGVKDPQFGCIYGEPEVPADVLKSLPSPIKHARVRE